MDLLHAEFKRKFSLSLHKSLRLSLAEMSFAKDFVHDKRGDLYPILARTAEAAETVEGGSFRVSSGALTRFFCAFFPYATYEVTGRVRNGRVGFRFLLPCGAWAALSFGEGSLYYETDEGCEARPLPPADEERTMLVSCRPSYFDVYFKKTNGVEYFGTFDAKHFRDANLYEVFSSAKAALTVMGDACVTRVLSYLDSGIGIADMRPIRYENGEVMVKEGKIYLTVSLRMQAEALQGVISWVPGTAELSLTGVMLYDAGDGRWASDVAASVLYHRKEDRWLLWVPSFSHGHILAHAAFDGDPRFGVNVIDVCLEEQAPEGADVTAFYTFPNDEDPDFFFDETAGLWRMAVCRTDPETNAYRYLFFESERPFDGYRFVGRGLAGAETGGSFVRVEGELYFLCGNAFDKISDYRIYHRGGVETARFDHPDGGFRGWGTLIPVKMGSRTRYFWLTFDRHNGSDYNWSYGNLYCFEAF